MGINSHNTNKRLQQLKDVAEMYFNALRNKNFDTIPYHNTATLRAPFTPGGVNVPLKGKDEIYAQWWKPLEPALERVTIDILGHYFHENLEGIITEATITLAAPAVTLRVADRFMVNGDGEITEQENHVDPREVTG